MNKIMHNVIYTSHMLCMCIYVYGWHYLEKVLILKESTHLIGELGKHNFFICKFYTNEITDSWFFPFPLLIYRHILLSIYTSDSINVWNS